MGVMGQNFAGGGRTAEQVFLMPPDPREWLPAGHLAWALLDQAELLDMTPFARAYRADGQGRPAYHPRLVTALVMYCYCKGIRSSRAIEMATWDDVGARVIMGGLHPDHSTCAREGLVSVDVVAGDGTKVKASASKSANATAARLDLDIAELEAVIAAEADAWLAQARAEDAADDALLAGGDGGRGGDDGPGRAGGPGTLKRTADMLARRQQARARLAAEAAARQQEAEAARLEGITR